MAGIIKVNQYQDFNGNTLFTSDGSGNLTTQNIVRPAFRASQNANQAIPTGAYTKITMDVEQKDTNNAYDTSLSRFTVPSGYAGQYFFSAQIRISGLSDGKIPQLLIYKNGALDNNARVIATMGVADNWSDNVTYTMECSEGEYFEVYGYHNYGSNRDTSASFCNFQGFRIIGT